MMGWQWHQLIKSFAPRSRQIATPVPHHSVFTGRMPFLSPNQQRQSTEGIISSTKSEKVILFSSTSSNSDFANFYVFKYFLWYLNI